MKRIILVGKSGSGKSVLRDYLSKSLVVHTGFTTRPTMGDTEPYPPAYNYISEEAFENMKLGEQLLVSHSSDGYNYGISKEGWDYSDVFTMTPSGVSHIPKADRKHCVVVYLDIIEFVRRVRLNQRLNTDSVTRQLEKDATDFTNFSDYDLRITNHNFDPKKILDLINFYVKCDTE